LEIRAGENPALRLFTYGKEEINETFQNGSNASIAFYCVPS
jgi:hypothetical protein